MVYQGSTAPTLISRCVFECRILGQKGETKMLYAVIGILLLLWLLGFAMRIGGGLIHALLVVAVVIFLFNFLTGRRTVG
jgi:hypothetical protein